MKKNLAAAVIALSAVSVPLGALADAPVFWDGNALYAAFQGDSADQVMARGYVIGVADTVNGAEACIPPSVKASQAGDVVFQALRDNPAIRQYIGSALVAAALKTAWPCPKKPVSNQPPM